MSIPNQTATQNPDPASPDPRDATPAPALWAWLRSLPTSGMPLGARIALWKLLGTAMGIPVDDLLGSIHLQLTAAKRQLRGKRLQFTETERITAARHAAALPGSLRSLFPWILSPAALTRWLKRHQIRKAQERSTPKGPGRPWIGQDKVQAILKIYDSGHTGLKRIVGEMQKCGLPVAKSTVRRVLTANDRSPTDRNRKHSPTWAQFWQLHAKHTVGLDFISMPVGLLGPVVETFVLLAIAHDTRRVEVLGITTNPTDLWTANVLRSATMDGAPLADRAYWIRDRDAKYGPQCRTVLGDRDLPISIRAPDMHAFIERFNQSIKRECLNHVVFLNQSMLEEAVQTYVAHYNAERPHQGIGNRPIGPWTPGTQGPLIVDERMPGLLHSFRRAA